MISLERWPPCSKVLNPRHADWALPASKNALLPHRTHLGGTVGRGWEEVHDHRLVMQLSKRNSSVCLHVTFCLSLSDCICVLVCSGFTVLIQEWIHIYEDVHVCSHWMVSLCSGAPSWHNSTQCPPGARPTEGPYACIPPQLRCFSLGPLTASTTLMPSHGASYERYVVCKLLSSPPL